MKDIPTKDYNVSLYLDTEPKIDIDELECIIQQLEAITMGWGHDFGKVFVEEVEKELLYKWENKDA